MGYRRLRYRFRFDLFGFANDFDGAVMNNLISISYNDALGLNAVSARELHSFLEVGRDFSTWFKERVEQFYFEEFEENVDYVSVTVDKDGALLQNPSGLITESMRLQGFRKEYYVSISMAKELSKVERNEQGRRARKYFIEWVAHQLSARSAGEPTRKEGLKMYRGEEMKRLLFDIVAVVIVSVALVYVVMEML